MLNDPDAESKMTPALFSIGFMPPTAPVAVALTNLIDPPSVESICVVASRHTKTSSTALESFVVKAWLD